MSVERDDLRQAKAIDEWIVQVLRRAGVPVFRMRDGGLGLDGVPMRWAAIIDALSAGIHAAARGDELPQIAPPVACKQCDAPLEPRIAARGGRQREFCNETCRSRHRAPQTAQASKRRRAQKKLQNGPHSDG